MKKAFHVIEKDNRFFLYKEEEEFRTVIQNTISSVDKGLVEVIARKMNEGKPNIVNLYLCNFDRQGLIDLVKDLSTNDIYSIRLSIELPEFLNGLKDIQLRKIANVYSECGDIGLAILVGTIDADDYDWFGAGMAACSEIGMDPVEDWADMIIEELCTQYAEHNSSGEDIDDEYYHLMDEMENMIPRDDLVKFMWKYCDYLLPKGPKAKSSFFDWIH